MSKNSKTGSRLEGLTCLPQYMPVLVAQSDVETMQVIKGPQTSLRAKRGDHNDLYKATLLLPEKERAIAMAFAHKHWKTLGIHPKERRLFQTKGA